VRVQIGGAQASGEAIRSPTQGRMNEPSRAKLGPSETRRARPCVDMLNALTSEEASCRCREGPIKRNWLRLSPPSICCGD
jgi:hypothetical protein